MACWFVFMCIGYMLIAIYLFNCNNKTKIGMSFVCAKKYKKKLSSKKKDEEFYLDHHRSINKVVVYSKKNFFFLIKSASHNYSIFQNL